MRNIEKTFIPAIRFRSALTCQASYYGSIESNSHPVHVRRPASEVQMLDSTGLRRAPE
jgi:hypothetical protein